MLMEVRDRRPRKDDGFRGGRVLTRPSGIGADTDRFAWELALDGAVATLSLHAHPPKRAVTPRALVRRAVGRHRRDGVAEALSYHGFWAFLHLALLRHDRAFLHGGCLVDAAGVSHVVAGAGGSGKTSTTLGLVEKYRWRYQAEDYALLEADGTTHLSPRPLTVYHSDVRWGNPLLAGYEEALPPLEKLRWHALARAGRNPRHRVRFDRLFDASQVAFEGAPIGSASFIRRTTTSGTLDIRDVDRSTMAEHLLGASMRELFALYEPLCQALGALGPEISDDFRIEHLFAATRAVYLRALERARCVLITASHDVPPARIADVIGSHA